MTEVTPQEELFSLAQKLKDAASNAKNADVTKPLDALEGAALAIGRSFSGSWQGYHSRVYYSDFSPPPPGAHFSQEWGLTNEWGESVGNWRECDPEDVKALILKKAGEPDLDIAQKAAKAASETFDSAKAEIVSVLQNEIEERNDAFLEDLKTQIGKLNPLSSWEIAQRIAPKGTFMTRDTIVLGQGAQVPPHQELLGVVTSIRLMFSICDEGSDIARKAASHLNRKSRKRRVPERVGSNVFIGHGRSPAWRDLKDFVQDRLRLPWDEFNRVPVAGVTNIARLSEMLDNAAIAFLVLSAEDEMVDGEFQARMNVIHEAGLFQGRLGFSRAIVMLEDGCEQFSNIDGLGQIRFPREKISGTFEEVRRVLEREGLIEQS